MEKISSEQWKKIEEKVGTGEKAERRRRRAAAELYEETGLTKGARAGMQKEAILQKSKRKRVAERAMEQEGAFEEEVKEILGEADSPERLLIRLREKNLIFALRGEQNIGAERIKLLEEETQILRGIKEEPSGAEQEALDEVRKELGGLDANKEELMKSSPEAYFGLHLKELKDYKKDLARGRIVETPYVKEQAEDITAHLRAGKPVLIYGHLGSGKTELAMHIAREYLGKEALVISGSKHTTPAELYGHQVLAIDKINKAELDTFAKEVEQKFNEWVKENPQADESEKNRAHDRILQVYLTQFKGGTISDFFLGPIYRAMAEGRPVIIDEVNAIPHEVLISLNHILTRRVGEKINVQQNSGSKVEVKEGFGVMMTGNLNQGQEKYIDRQDMDPAFLSRLYKLEYDYLPQKTEGALSTEAGKESELFQLLLAKIMDKNGSIEAPVESVKKLWNLAKAARVTEDVFAGKEVASAYYLQEAGGRAVRYLLKESVLSIRALDSILTQWQKDGYKQELDYYLWKEFVSQSTVASDKAYLYQLLKDRFNFFQGTGWEQNPNYGSSGVINIFDVKPPKNPPGKKEFLGPRETVECAFGRAPERAAWPEAVAKETAAEAEEETNIEELEGLRGFKSFLGQNLPRMEQEIEESCSIGG